MENVNNDIVTTDDVQEVNAAQMDSSTAVAEPEPAEPEPAKDDRPKKEIAIEKLKKELNKAKNKYFADPVIGYLLKRCEEDEGLAEDVAQDHKTWSKCFNYITTQARKQAEGNCAAVRDDVVYEWAEDYFHRDDKAEEARKAKREAATKERREKEEAKRAEMRKKQAPVKEEKPKEAIKPKKNTKEIEGQMDMFSMFGM